MTTSLTATFETWREAEITAECLIHECGIQRRDVYLSAVDPGESDARDSADASGTRREPRGESIVEGAVAVWIDRQRGAAAERVWTILGAFREERGNQEE